MDVGLLLRPMTWSAAYIRALWESWFMSIKGKVPGITEKDILAIARENDMTCDIMRKELNDKYTSFE